MKHIPNALTVLRIVIIPFFVWQLLTGNTLAAGILLAASGLTDLLDGALARRFGWISDLGKVLDPVADKLTQAAVSICLILRLRQYWPFFAVLLVKDFMMLVLGGWLLKKGVKLEGSRWFGKVATFVFYGAMVLIVFIPGMPGWLATTLIALSTGFALLAAALYIPEFLRYKKKLLNESE